MFTHFMKGTNSSLKTGVIHYICVFLNDFLKVLEKV